MRPVTLAITLAFGLLLAGGASAKAAQCKDAAGKFIKCPPAAAKPAPAPAAAKAGPCKDASGKFIKCGAATPAVAVAAKPAKPVPAAKPTPVAAAHTVAAPTGVSHAGAPAGATAKCKDGTFSMSKVHSGACSSHGGVAGWL